jgi:hypothetical protein
MPMWAIFWCVWLLIAAVSFAAITLAVAWHGIPELRALVRSFSKSTNCTLPEEDED